MKQNQKTDENHQIQTIKQFKSTDQESKYIQKSNIIQDKQTAIDIIQKQIQLNYDEQFKKYQQVLCLYSIHLQDLIQQEIEQQNQYNWKICQTYSLSQIHSIISNLRNRYQSFINLHSKEIDMNPQNIKNNFAKKQDYSPSFKNDSKIQSIDSKNFLTKEINLPFLPNIKTRGKIYNQKDLSSSFHLLKQTEQEYQVRSPLIFKSELSKIKQQSKGNLFNNKYLKMSFKHFCKQSYNTKGLFAQYSQQADKMNLNKWMVFCKQFCFNQKFNKKELIQIFQKITKFGPFMNQDDFLTAVAIIQQKYINKYKVGENFVSQVMQINSEAAFRVKMANLKVSYAGPKINFYQYGRYPEHIRLQQIKKQKQFQSKKKQRQMVLIKGMFESHLKDELHTLKLKRQAKKDDKLSKSLVVKDQKNNNNDQFVQKSIATKVHRFDQLTYARRFSLNKSQATNKKYTSTTSTNPTNHQNRTQLSKSQFKNIVKEQIATPTPQKIGRTTPRYQDIYKTKKDASRQWIAPKQEQTMWMTRLRSDSQQSDDILKQHLQIQKKVKTNQPTPATIKLMKEMQLKTDWVQSVKKDLQRHSIIDDQMIETQAYFDRQKETFH